MSEARKTIGWREWVALPTLGGTPIKAKVDTGARTSTLHAFDVTEIEREGEPYVHFKVHPVQRNEQTTVEAAAPLVGRRSVTSSSGQSELRYVVSIEALIDGERIPIELTLTRRDAMGFRMLLGREAIRGRFVVDPGRSYMAAESKAVRRRARRERASR
jgi:hypothetical protein